MIRALIMALVALILAAPMGCGGSLGEGVGQRIERAAVETDKVAQSAGIAAHRLCQRLTPDRCPPERAMGVVAALDHLRVLMAADHSQVKHALRQERAALRGLVHEAREARQAACERDTWRSPSGEPTEPGDVPTDGGPPPAGRLPISAGPTEPKPAPSTPGGES
jgi:hypothetical protein